MSNPFLAVGASVSLAGGNPVLNIELHDDVRVSFPLSRISSFRMRPALRKMVANAGSALRKVVVEEDGMVISWPDLEVDFSVAEMLPEYLGFVTAQQTGRIGGRARSASKSEAARENGKRGGRPRKSAA